MEKIEFQGSNIFLQGFKSNKDSFRVSIDCGIDSYQAIKDIPLLPEGMYKVTIEPIDIE